MTCASHSWPAPPESLILPPDEVHVWRAVLDLDKPGLDSLLHLLVAEERARADRFHFRIHRDRFIVARGSLRILLARYLEMEPSELRFCYNSHGKPFLPAESGGDGLSFNVTHSEGLALFAVTRNREVGVDLERVRPDQVNEEIAKRNFSPMEVARLRALPRKLQVKGFFNCWSRKEAYLKARGEGLTISLDQFEVSLAPGEPARLLSVQKEPGAVCRWTLQELSPDPGYVAALAVEGHDWRLRCWEWQSLSYQQN